MDKKKDTFGNTFGVLFVVIAVMVAGTILGFDDRSSPAATAVGVLVHTANSSDEPHQASQEQQAWHADHRQEIQAWADEQGIDVVTLAAIYVGMHADTKAEYIEGLLHFTDEDILTLAKEGDTYAQWAVEQSEQGGPGL